MVESSSHSNTSTVKTPSPETTDTTWGWFVGAEKQFWQHLTTLPRNGVQNFSFNVKKDRLIMEKSHLEPPGS